MLRTVWYNNNMDKIVKVFAAEEYDFTDSILCDIKRDEGSADYLLTVDLYLGKDKNKVLTLRLKNVKCLNINANVNGGDALSAYTLSHIEKRDADGEVGLICYSSRSFLSGHREDMLLYCMCDEVYVEE